MLWRNLDNTTCNTTALREVDGFSKRASELLGASNINRPMLKGVVEGNFEETKQNGTRTKEA
jgi:hypothetical protein